MDRHCHVICGEWECGYDGEWVFSVDKEKLARIVPVSEGIALHDLEVAVAREFGVFPQIGVSLSYWSPSSLQFMTGKKTPPVMVTSDVGLAYYLKLARHNKGLNLFVKFKIGSKRGNSKGMVEGGASNGIDPKRRCGTEDVSRDFPTSGSVAEHVVVVDDDEVLAEVEEVEARITEKRGPIVSEAETGCNCGEPVQRSSVENSEGVDEGSSDEEDGLGVLESPVEGEEIVEPEGYDREFWGNFLDEDYGGSNAVEVMCSEIDGIEGVKAKEEDIKRKVMESAWTDPCGQEKPIGNRKLEDVDDEEFDIPPLFDDTEYEVDDIPDLDRNDEEVYEGKVYASKEDCQIGLAIYAIKNMFYFKQTTTKRDYFVLTCPAEKCDWRIMAHERKESCYYEVRKAQLEHSCTVETKKQFMKKATSRVIAAVYKAKYGEPVKGPKPMDLQQLILEDMKVSSSYSKCWRAREKAVEEVLGLEEDTFSKLPEYLHLLKLANPGTITDIVTDIMEDGSERFLYMFLAFGASIEGFRHLRRVLVVDGTHLNGKYKGVLLTASGQDANFQVFPLAFAVVDSENDASWTWFFQKVERIIADSVSLTIISDRHQSIYAAKSRVFPKAHHGACIVHLERNVTARFKNKGLARMVRNAGCEFKIAAFKKLYKEIKSRNHECALYLEKIGMAHWTRVYFQGDRYNLMTSNIAESLNKALVGGRSLPILELVKFIRAMLTRWFSARRKKSGEHTELVPPYVDKIMTKTMMKMSASKVGNITSWSYEIVGQFGEKHHVLLDSKRCNCKVYDKLKIPCGHALLAASIKNIEFGSLVGECLKTAPWVATYLGVVNPEQDESEVDIPAEVNERFVRPPKTRRPSGRPRELRIPSIGEFKVRRIVIYIVLFGIVWKS